MNTRCVVRFATRGSSETKIRILAEVYRHSDGYPEHMIGDLADFFCTVESQTRDTRFSDPSYLAAKYVVWLAQNFCDDKSKPLAFLSVGVVRGSNVVDAEYVYTIFCHKRVNGRPLVKVKAV